jgi:hypothetical protein
MSNYKITPSLQAGMLYHVKRLMELRSTTIEQDFPLTRKQIIEAAVPTALRAAFKTLTDAGADSLVTTRTLHARVEGEGFDRPCLVQMFCQQEMPYVHREQIYSSEARRAFKEGAGSKGTRLPFDLSVLDEGSKAALVLWTSSALGARRVARGTQKLIAEFLTFAPTLADLDQRWPDLKLVFAKMDQPWPQRIRDLPATRIKSAWKWPLWGAEHDWYQAYREKMQVAGRVLTEAVVMDNGVAMPEQKIKAQVIDWA